MQLVCKKNVLNSDLLVIVADIFTKLVKNGLKALDN